MRDLPVRKVPGFGRVTERCLEGLGVEVRARCHFRHAEYSAYDLDLRRHLRQASRAPSDGSLVRILWLMVSHF